VCVADRFADVELEDLMVEHIAHAGDLDRLRAVSRVPRMMPEVDAIYRVVPDSDALEGPSPCHGTDPAEAADLQHPDGLRATNLGLDETLDHRQGDRAPGDRQRRRIEARTLRREEVQPDAEIHGFARITRPASRARAAGADRLARREAARGRDARSAGAVVVSGRAHRREVSGRGYGARRSESAPI